MSDTASTLDRKIGSAVDLQAVVRTMKAVAASSIGQYERAVRALGDYYRTVELGLGACIRARQAAALQPARNGRAASGVVGAIVFGSDQGLVGKFNDEVVELATRTLGAMGGVPHVWAVGERVHARLQDAGLSPKGLFAVPCSVNAITPLVGQIQLESEARRAKGEYSSVYVFHNRPKSGALYEPVSQRLLPLDAQWQHGLAELHWPTANGVEIMGGDADAADALRALVREYLFISLFRACAESLASENASRLAAMERADKNIDELLEGLHGTFHRLRQSGIDEELFDVIAGFEAQGEAKRRTDAARP